VQQYIDSLGQKGQKRVNLKMKTIEVTLQGVSPLLINRFKENDEVQPKMKKAGKKDYGTPREQAEMTAYQDEATGKIWMPSSWIKGAIQTVASDYKLPSSRKSVKSVSGGAIRPVEEKLYFLEDYVVSNVEIDSRPCVVQRARIMRHRARLEAWSVRVSLELENDIIDEDSLYQMIVDAGRRAGLGDFRPQKGGPFGRFLVSEWKVLKEIEVAVPEKKRTLKKESVMALN
jgi:hypothetical protein